MYVAIIYLKFLNFSLRKEEKNTCCILLNNDIIIH